MVNAYAAYDMLCYILNKLYIIVVWQSAVSTLVYPWFTEVGIYSIEVISSDIHVTFRVIKHLDVYDVLRCH